MVGRLRSQLRDTAPIQRGSPGGELTAWVPPKIGYGERIRQGLRACSPARLGFGPAGCQPFLE